MSEQHLNLKSKLASRESNGSLRKLKLNGNLIDFCSNDYLGMAANPRLKTREKTDDNHVQNGATGSRLIRGNTKQINDLEDLIANVHQGEAALLFNSGYTANLGFFSCVPQRGDTVIYDELVHASIRDGIRLSHAIDFSFRHNDVGDLMYKAQHAKGNVFVAVESVYSMDGDAAPLLEMANICAEKGWNLIVDEAHSAGIYGPDGEGMCVELGIESICMARIVTYGKAFGCHGAAVIGSSILKEFLVNFSRPFIYTTALPPTAVETISLAYSEITNANEQRQNLFNLIQRFNLWKKTTPEIQFIPSTSAIHTLVIPGNKEVKSAAHHIQQAGFDVRAIMSPTVAKGLERLRICLHSFNTPEELVKLQLALETSRDK